MAHVILVSARVPLVLTLGLWTLGLWDFGLGLDNNKRNEQTFLINMVQVSFKDLDTKSDKDSSLLKNVVKFM